MAKTIGINAFGFIDLYEFEDFVDIDMVHYYKFKVNKDKTLTLKFYDKKKKLIKPSKKG